MVFKIKQQILGCFEYIMRCVETIYHSILARVFKGEIKLKQKWFDDYEDKMSIKSLILAGNVEQAVSIMTNSICLTKDG